MLAWLIVTTVVDLLLIIAYYHVIKKLNDYSTKTDKLLGFDFYSRERDRYLFRPTHKADTYDSTPVFVEGVLEMRDRLNRLEQKPVRYSQYHRDTGIDERSFELLEERVDNIADTVGGMDNRLDELDSDIRNLKERVDCLEFKGKDHAAE